MMSDYDRWKTTEPEPDLSSFDGYCYGCLCNVRFNWNIMFNGWECCVCGDIDSNIQESDEEYAPQ